MNSTLSDDLPRDHLALEAAKCIENIFANNQNLCLLHKELLEVNLSVTAYIEESKRRLAGLRLDLAHEAHNSHKVVEILSEKCKFISHYQSKIMSQSSTSPQKRKSRITTIKKPQGSSHDKNKFAERQQAKNFVAWYKQMIDNERQNIGLYLSDDAILEWFGRTIKTRKKVATFLKHDMQCTRHDFVSIKNIDKIQSRQDREPRNEEHKLSSLLHYEINSSNSERIAKKRNLRSNCSSPEWAEGCQPLDEMKDMESKKLQLNNFDPSNMDSKDEEVFLANGVKRRFNAEDSADINCRGDGVLDRRVKRKCEPVTPPNCELGQGDCVPSTSGTDSDRSHDALNAQLPKLFVECKGYIQFTRTRNSRSNDAVNWERKCKVQISFSEDPLNIGEYIVWVICYTDESKCRRNLLSAFEEVATEELKKNVNLD